MNNFRIPVSTYRLQFNHDFTFKQAVELVDYFNELGITDLYASPIMKAKAESNHGYDAIDPAKINPEIGSEEEFSRLSSLLKQKNMGFILDIVPNHMCISDSGNLWWLDLLENGPGSIFAPYFDIYWDHPNKELKNKVLLPILSLPIGKIIEQQNLKVFYANGSFSLDYAGRYLPLNPKSWPIILKPAIDFLLKKTDEENPDILELNSILAALDNLPELQEIDPIRSKQRHREKEVIKKRLSFFDKNPLFLESIQKSLNAVNGNPNDPRSFDLLEHLLKEQAYRLSYWRLTNDLINYRRFFEINDLACLHSEKLEVFEVIHSKVFEFVSKGWVTGLRIDHLDGLYDPKGYLERLQAKQPNQVNLYTIIEKILLGKERLNKDWPINGTTGYDFLNQVNGLFVQAEHRFLIQQFYDQFIGFHNDLEEVIYPCKKLILLFSMSSELNLLAQRLEVISQQHRSSYDLAFENLRWGLRELIACFPVYRTYIGPKDQQVSATDEKIINYAADRAKEMNPEGDSLVFEFIKTVLFLQHPPGLDEKQIEFRREFIQRFQQLTGPVMAKGFEDTALYRAYPLSSLNEVGMDAKNFGTKPEEFHQANCERAKNWPYTLLTTFTHDTKRSEDARARINVLSENPYRWKEAINQWRHLNKPKKLNLDSREVPDWNEEYLLYQTLVCSWPDDGRQEPMLYVDRIQKYMLKALKEAKVHTSWINPNENYEKAVSEFVAHILDRSRENPFLDEFEIFIQEIIKAGKLNSLSQLLLKISSPGIPDFYQGSEMWEWTLVDPDNRQPVDYENRKKALDYLKEMYGKDRSGLIKELWENDPMLKMYVTWIGLNFRKSNSDLFQLGEYIPINVEGGSKLNFVAFARKHAEKACIVVSGRFFTQITDLKNHWPPLEYTWEQAWIDIPADFYGTYRDVYGGLEIKLEDSVEISKLFYTFHLFYWKKSFNRHNVQYFFFSLKPII